MQAFIYYVSYSESIWHIASFLLQRMKFGDYEKKSVNKILL